MRTLQAAFRSLRAARDVAFARDLKARSSFNKPDEANLRAVFAFIDASGDGNISVAEFTGAIRRAGMCVRW